MTEADAATKLRTEGHNELPHAQRRSLWKIVVEVFREPMFRLLIAAGVVYLALGDLGEAILLLLFAAGNVAITVVQQHRTERALEALRDLSSPRALVVRDGVQRRIPGREVVRGDIVLLSEGDRVPADALVLSSTDLRTDESLLTGESVPVSKTAALELTGSPRPGGDGLPFVFSGSLIVSGRGVAEVRATGRHSEIGRIGVLLSEIHEESTPLSAQLQRLVRALAMIGLATSAAVVLIYGVVNGAWLQGLLAGIALAMALLPQEFPLVLMIFLALGARRIAQHHVLSRRAATIETLGSATVLCADKTGTLTVNRMKVAELRIPGVIHSTAADVPATKAVEHLVRCAVMASAQQPTDPMEKALLDVPGCEISVAGERGREYGLSPELLAMSCAWKLPGQAEYTIAAKGAPETIAELCKLSGPENASMRLSVQQMASRGMRVIGVAQATFAGDDWPETQRAFQYSFVGLIGLADPVRPSVPAAIRECRAAGIRVIMVTGDYPDTARAIAAQAGLDVSTAVLSGTELESLDDEALRKRMANVSICARAMPKHKLRIVQVLKAAGEVVAMTGDGVNDAPSLRAAHIGIAMGGRGTDVARESSAMVLLDDEFSSIVQAMKLGRRIYDNIRKAMAYILAVHVPIAGLTLLPLLLGWPVIIGPVHIVFLELVIDPVCSIVFEAEPAEADVMRRRPRAPGEPLFSGRLILWSLFQGACVLALLMGFHAAMRGAGLPEADSRAITFVSLVATNVALIFVNRSFSSSLASALRRPNPALWLVLTSVVALLSAVLYVPLVKRMFGFGTLHWNDLFVCAAAGLLLLYGLQGSKRWISPLGRKDVKDAGPGPS